MRKFFFSLFVLVGAGAGALAAHDESLGLAVVLGSIGAVAGTAIGAAVTGVGNSRRRPRAVERDSLSEMFDKRTESFWLDRGRCSDAPGLPNADDLDPHSFEP